MCMIDDGERSTVWNEVEKTARKAHVCTECRRTINPGESYVRIASLFEGSWDTYKQCAHCCIVTKWLTEECSGYLAHGVYEDIHEHAREYRTLPLWRLTVGMARKWQRFDGAGLMPIQKMPPLSAPRAAA